MNYENISNISFLLLLISVICLLNGKLAVGRALTNVRDYIATDHAESASSVDKTDSKDLPEDLSRKEMVEVLHSGQYFQDIFMEQLAPHKLQFGHVCENPKEWQQRFEQNDFDKNRFKGKVRWGDANGAYGEHYWDLGHAG